LTDCGSVRIGRSKIWRQFLSPRRLRCFGGFFFSPIFGLGGIEVGSDFCFSDLDSGDFEVSNVSTLVEIGWTMAFSLSSESSDKSVGSSEKTKF
jgi:hypothetical protein